MLSDQAVLRAVVDTLTTLLVAGGLAVGVLVVLQVGWLLRWAWRRKRRRQQKRRDEGRR